jgi:hypothetical protein
MWEAVRRGSRNILAIGTLFSILPMLRDAHRLIRLCGDIYLGRLCRI